MPRILWEQAGVVNALAPSTRRITTVTMVTIPAVTPTEIIGRNS
jgi:hypothetical protein